MKYLYNSHSFQVTKTTKISHIQPENTLKKVKIIKLFHKCHNVSSLYLSLGSTKPQTWVTNHTFFVCEWLLGKQKRYFCHHTAHKTSTISTIALNAVKTQCLCSFLHLSESSLWQNERVNICQQVLKDCDIMLFKVKVTSSQTPMCRLFSKITK